MRQNRGSEFASFASTAGGIHTFAERRAARQSSSARTANATTPQVYPLLRRSSSARSPAYAVALAAADSAPDLRVRIRAELKSMTLSVTKLRADDAAACSTSSQYLTKRSSLLLEYAPIPWPSPRTGWRV